MLSILAPIHSSRLIYTLDLIFGRILQVPYQILSPSDILPDGPVINYTDQKIPSAFSLPNSGLLGERHISTQLPSIRQAELPFLFPMENAESDLAFDVFAAVFYLLSAYERYVHLQTDQHGRYNAGQYLDSHLKLDRLPLVHLYAEYLWQALQSKRLALPPREEKTYDYQITIDVDNPWKYLHKGVGLALGGIAKDILNRRWTGLRERLRSYRTGQDPYHTFEQLYALCPPEKTRFFFLLNRQSPHDNRFSWRLPVYRELMKEIWSKGYSYGIHPSYTSFLSPALLREEQEALRSILGQEIVSSRQHFLRYRLPETFRSLYEIGIREEYSTCLFETGGFPAGMAQPYPWFDLEKNEATDLMIWPTHLMDRTLQQYLALSPEAALARAQELVEATKAVGGTLVLLLHNDSLSESEEWAGWRRSIRAQIDLVKRSTN